MQVFQRKNQWTFFTPLFLLLLLVSGCGKDEAPETETTHPPTTETLDEKIPPSTSQVFYDAPDTAEEGIFLTPEEPETSLPVQTVIKYFEHLNAEDFESACAALSDEKCHSENEGDIIAFSGEPKKFVNGYENIEIWEPVLSEAFHSELVCVKYSYQLRDDITPQEDVWEVLSFYLDTREDGSWEITARVCEKKYKDGFGNGTCPFPARKTFCVEK